MHKTVAFAAAIWLAPIAFAAAGSSDDAPTSKTAELDALSFFEGFWHCDEQANFAGETQEETSVLVVQKELEHSWYTFKWDAGSSSASTFTHGHAYVSWDPLLKKYVDFTFSINGGYGAAMSDGFDGDKLVWNGGINNYEGKTVFLRKTYEKTAENTFILSVEVSEDGTTYGTPAKKTCTKGKGTPKLG